MSKAQDQSDRRKAGTLSEDPTAETKTVSAKVPRVLTVEAVLASSGVRALSEKRINRGCTSTHWKIDRITGGLRPSFTWLVGADTSWGKSSYLIAIADDNIKAGKRVLIVSSEDTEEVYGDRLMIRRTKVDALRYRDQELNEDERILVQNQMNAGEPVPVYVDARRWNIEDLAPHITKIIRDEKIDVVAFDYVQEFRSKRRHQDERVKYREIASMCRHIAKDAKIAGIIFSQLTLDDKTKVPNRHNIRECRDIANAAEVILIGFEPEKAIEDKDGNIIVCAGAKCIFVDKVKNGPRGAKVALEWNEDSACFETVAPLPRARSGNGAADARAHD